MILSTKKASWIAVSALFISSPVFAQYYEDEAKAPVNSGSYGSTVSLGGSSAVQGIISYSNYRKASQTRAKSTEVILDKKTGPKKLESEEINSMSQKFENGDEVSIVHHLNEKANRLLTIENLESEISSHETSATSHQIQSLTAMKPKYETVYSNGQSSTRCVGQEPDVVMRLYHAAQASSELQAAQDKKIEVNEVINGKEIPFIDIDAVFQGDESHGRGVASKMKKWMEEGGKIVSVKRLPRAAFEIVKKAELIGNITLVTTGLSVAATGYEFFTGKISNAISKDLIGDRLSQVKALPAKALSALIPSKNDYSLKAALPAR